MKSFTAKTAYVYGGSSGIGLAIARSALKGIRAGRFVIVPGADGWFTYWASRMMPGMVFRIMDADARRAVRAHQKAQR